MLHGTRLSDTAQTHIVRRGLLSEALMEIRQISNVILTHYLDHDELVICPELRKKKNLKFSRFSILSHVEGTRTFPLIVGNGGFSMIQKQMFQIVAYVSGIKYLSGACLAALYSDGTYMCAYGSQQTHTHHRRNRRLHAMQTKSSSDMPCDLWIFKRCVLTIFGDGQKILHQNWAPNDEWLVVHCERMRAQSSSMYYMCGLLKYDRCTYYY